MIGLIDFAFAVFVLISTSTAFKIALPFSGII
jgi:hypothetical protein